MHAGNRLTQITAPSPDGTAPQPVTTFAYDYRGRRTSVTDANNKTTTYAYDDDDRLTSVTDAANHVTTYADVDLARIGNTFPSPSPLPMENM